MNKAPKTIISGIQTSGNLHLGNYLGAINNWVELQHEGECYFFLADLHALTTTKDPSILRQATLETTAAYLASGLNADQVNIFKQSDVPGHCELAWLFNCFTPMGWLNRMTQFKDKAGKNREKAILGLYSYPVLMAADILLYQPQLVPVGDDQKQHLELCRDLAISINQQFGCDFFVLPEPLILGQATRVMSLRDGNKKMSKSDSSDNARINLLDDTDTIAQKIKRAKSDADVILASNYQQRPELNNLITIIAALNNTSTDKVINEYEGQGFKLLKDSLTEIVIEKIGPIGKEMQRLLTDQHYLIKVLDDGQEKANARANRNLSGFKQLIGLK
ncbi:MAG: tryptophan--tRNA ligase [Pseudomonadota bacterium]